MNTIIKKIKGAFALVFLFGDGITPFTGERLPALRSFLIPLGLLPLSLWAATILPPLGMEGKFSDASIMRAVAAQSLMSTLLSLLIIFGLAVATKQKREAWRFIEALNWIGLVMTAFGAPLLLTAAQGWVTRDETDRLGILFELYGVIVTACAANRSFRLNWQLAGAIACFMLVAGQESWAAVYRIWQIPYLWDV